ncbi:LIM/homeobox protein lim-7-like [Daphnia pulex]|uniref:LIM/homeobox protein lim-7-like n=1 Tax=Daphnia pulex TaxID=6669 RepID=UPI001EDCABEE|nr:LIM/homeobox protein lim-7-like [Daphnia pulex]XP_046446360.1 LIM/homeobox protein lim-7-like [Daphnia pulex]XP_046446361.1 LIM/homeobox protein lim-7-like [Daphnia pulex]
MQTEQQPLLLGGGQHHHHLHHHPLQQHHSSVSAVTVAAAVSVGPGPIVPSSVPGPVRTVSSHSAVGSLGVNNSATSGSSLCVGCGSPIQDQYILRVAPDLEWHASCLKCVECGIFLDENCTCFVRDGKTFCRRDYVRLFGAKCDKCGLGFSRSDFVMRAKSKIYHIECFRCALCQRQLVPGDEFALRDDGNLFCKDDHDQTNNNNNNSSNQNNNNNGGNHHHHGHHHHHHHHHLGSGGGQNSSSLMLLEAKSEHHNQSSNSSSGTVSFLPISNSSVKSHKSSSGRHSRANSNDSHSDSSDTCITTSTRKESGERSRGAGNSKGGMGGVGGSGGVSGGGGGGGSDGKPTRVRTVLNEKQLHTLRTCYAANPRPDALMKEQLVEMTGLSPRVIRVWFQNKRCKDKKKAILMKQIQQQEKDGRKLGFGSMQGIPLIASSPVRHGESSPSGGSGVGGGVGGGGGGGGNGGGGGGGGINPVEVHAFAPPWKALAEFALHNDLERIDPSAPHFQQLINQMHGYDIHGPPDHLSHHHHHHHHPLQHHQQHGHHHMGGGGGGGGPMEMGTLVGGIHHGGGIPHHIGVGPLQHPHQQQQQHDPSDAFVQFLDSDEDSMQHDGHSP